MGAGREFEPVIQEVWIQDQRESMIQSQGSKLEHS